MYREVVSEEIIYSYDLAGNFTSINEAGERLIGYSRDEFLHMHISQVFTPEYLESARQLIQKLNSPSTAEMQMVTKAGQRITLEMNARVICQSEKAVGVELIGREVTERKHLEAQLRQLQKMEAVGRLAGGVAHDFNNVLTAIRGYAELLMDSLHEDDLRKNAQEIIRATDRGASLTSQLLAFSRKQPLVPQILKLSKVVEQMNPMLQRLIGEDIELTAISHSEPGAIKADPGQLEQVIMNLVVNARDAMPSGGKLTLETSNVEFSKDYVRKHIGVSVGQYVMLAVSDTGEGMSAEVQSHLFEPFFTTKKEGTGLGLSTIYGIVKQSGGTIWVYSEPGQGTTFKIYFPRIEQSGSVESESAAPESDEASETVLLVEDDDSVRSIIHTVLRQKGYRVLEASNGSEALRLSSNPHEIDLLITDVVMPGMSGRELVECLCPRHPGIKILYLSGYAEDAVTRHGVLAPGINFLQKPFNPSMLRRKIREVLNGPLPERAADL